MSSDPEVNNNHQAPRPGDETEQGSKPSAEGICPECGGSGRCKGESCPTCDGSGVV